MWYYLFILLFIRIKIIQYMIYKNIEDSKIYIKYIGLTKTNCRYRYDIFNYFIVSQVRDYFKTISSIN